MFRIRHCRPLLLLAAVVFSPAAHAVPTEVSADILTPLELSEMHRLGFGAFIPSGTPGTVGSNKLPGTNGIARTAPGFTGMYQVTGEAGMNYSVTHDTTVQLQKGGDTMQATLALTLGGVALDATGHDIFGISGTLSVGANQAAGDYSGTFNVTVSY